MLGRVGKWNHRDITWPPLPFKRTKFDLTPPQVFKIENMRKIFPIRIPFIQFRTIDLRFFPLAHSVCLRHVKSHSKLYWEPLKFRSESTSIFIRVQESPVLPVGVFIVLWVGLFQGRNNTEALHHVYWALERVREHRKSTNITQLTVNNDVGGVICKIVNPCLGGLY